VSIPDLEADAVLRKFDVPGEWQQFRIVSDDGIKVAVDESFQTRAIASRRATLRSGIDSGQQSQHHTACKENRQLAHRTPTFR
jgi:hypothetical protein